MASVFLLLSNIDEELLLSNPVHIINHHIPLH